MYVLSVQETARALPPTPTYRDHGCDKYIPTARDDKVYDLNRSRPRVRVSEVDWGVALPNKPDYFIFTSRHHKNRKKPLKVMRSSTLCGPELIKYLQQSLLNQPTDHCKDASAG